MFASITLAASLLAAAPHPTETVEMRYAFDRAAVAANPQAVYADLQREARKTCAFEFRRFTTGHDKDCARVLVDKAVEKMNRTELTAVHQNETRTARKPRQMASR